MFAWLSWFWRDADGNDMCEMRIILGLEFGVQVVSAGDGDARLKARLTPCVDENGIRASLSGATISSIRDVAFSRKVSTS